MNYLRISVLFILLHAITETTLRAEHLVGGVLSYECLGNGSLANTKNYRFKLSLTRDCSLSTSFDTNIEIGIYQATGTKYAFYRKVSVPLTKETKVPLDQKSCAILLYNVCVAEAIYEFTVTDLPVINQDYLIAYQRCCRNMTITNILDPGRTGSTIMIEITPEAQQLCNQSATSNQLPPLVVCANQDLRINLASIDPDGDQLMYELCAPYTGGGPQGGGGSAGSPIGCNGINPDPAVCVPPLNEVSYANSMTTALNPFPSSTPIQLINGVLIATPSTLGQYIFGICIKEFRNGKLLSTLRRDIQINIALCSAPIKAGVVADNTVSNTATINLCDPNSPFEITNISADSQFIKTVFWEFKGPKGNIFNDTTFNFKKTFSDTGTYMGKLFLNRGNQCSDSLNVIVQSRNKSEITATVSYDSCDLSPAVFNLSSTTPLADLNIKWSFGDSTFSSSPQNTHQYLRPGVYDVDVVATNQQGCMAQKTLKVKYFPAPPNLTLDFPDSIFCFPYSLKLGLKEITDTTYTYNWSFSDGRNFSGAHPSVIFDKAVSSTLMIKLASPVGCLSQKSFSRTFVSKEKPIADFALIDDMINLRNPQIDLINRSVNAAQYVWNFGDGNTSTLANPQHLYDRTGRFTITLIATHANGCTDTTFQVLTIGEHTDFFAPNIFTPNGDGQNDLFKPLGLESNMVSFEMNIFDRWGGVLFKSTDPSIGWDGTSTKNISAHAADGVYLYFIKFTTTDGQQKLLKGSITLIR